MREGDGEATVGYGFEVYTGPDHVLSHLDDDELTKASCTKQDIRNLEVLQITFRKVSHLFTSNVQLDH